jgi:hypothetical protein
MLFRQGSQGQGHRQPEIRPMHLVLMEANAYCSQVTSIFSIWVLGVDLRSSVQGHASHLPSLCRAFFEGLTRLRVTAGETYVFSQTHSSLSSPQKACH